MHTQINSMLRSYENGGLSRRQFLEGMVMLAGAATASSQNLMKPAEPLVPVSINHVAIGVKDLARSTDWYTRLFQMEKVHRADRLSILRFGNTRLLLRPELPESKSVRAGRISHVMYGLAQFDEEGVVQRLLELGIDHPKKDGRSFHIKDPDGLDVQLGDEKMGERG
ncbi:MAG: VOC family protein [Acidobacteria bacterium]|nr:VOC family protein [Acidobacteriota bacterium]